jgi:RNA polymerase sigma-70 factor (ECF subfamily)
MMGVMAGPLADKALLASKSSSRDVELDQGSQFEAQFESWMASEQRRIYGVCQHMLQDRDEADSATQDTFMKAYRALANPERVDPADPAKWVTRIAVNTCLDRLRNRRWQFWRRNSATDDPQPALNATRSRAPEAEEQCYAREIRINVQRAVAKLSLRQRAVFSLRHYEEMTIDEIADVLALDPGTVKAHMHRAVEKLRVELRGLYGGRP